MRLRLLWGDCMARMQEMGEGSIGSVVCDPPYGLVFMNKEFDNLGDGALQQEWHRAWLNEVFRVLEPGKQAKIFGGTRVFHRLAMAMNEAGFQDLRLEAWGYGSGFPKSLNVSKSIDKAAGKQGEIVGYSRGVAVADNQGFGGIARGAVGIIQKGVDIPVRAPATPEAELWVGWGTACKPAWEPVLVGTKVGSVAEPPGEQA